MTGSDDEPEGRLLMIRHADVAAAPAQVVLDPLGELLRPAPTP